MTNIEILTQLLDGNHLNKEELRRAQDLVSVLQTELEARKQTQSPNSVTVPKKDLENLVKVGYEFARYLEDKESDKPGNSEAVKYIDVTASKLNSLLHKS